VANEKNQAPTWIDVKAALTNFDRAGLLGLVQDLYGGSKDDLRLARTSVISGWGHVEIRKGGPSSAV
jgi:hypothetical protein